MADYTIEAFLKATGVDEFSRSLEQANKSVESIGGSTKKSTGGLKNFMGGVGKIAGAIGVTKLVSAGFNAIRDSVGGAVKRVDTLNQFPKMMEAIGFSSTQSEEAIGKLSDGIQGLPTRLDEVAGSAQQIAIMTGDLEGATDTTLALNNAFLASGSSSADAERGLTQYVQMLSKGEVDMQSWRTLQETMGVALNDTAKAFGFAGESAQNDLYAALQDGTITFDEFNDKIIELDGGIGGFAERALIGSEGIATSMQNIKTAITTGIANSIQTVNDAMEAGGFGSISDNLDKVKVAVQNSFATMNEGISTFVNFVAENMEIIEILTVSVGAMAVAFGIYTVALNWATITTALATAATTAFGAVLAFLTSPVTLVIAAIGALVATFMYFYNTNETVREAVDRAWLVIQEVITTVVGAVSGVVTYIWGALTDFWVDNNELIRETAEIVWNAIKTVITTVIGIVTPVVTGAWNAISTVTATVWGAIETYVSTAMNAILGIIQTIMQIITGDWEGAWNTMKETVSGVIEGVKSVIESLGDVDLFGAGKAIIDGFLGGLKSTWEAGKSFVTGIGGWIAKNKGPISYDRKLLTPAGDAIISGLNKGLEDSFPQVQSTVRGMAGAIQDSFNSNPSLDINGNIASSNAQVKSAVSHEINRNQSNTQPAYINLNIGGRVFKAFVDDITNAQDSNQDLELSYS